MRRRVKAFAPRRAECDDASKGSRGLANVFNYGKLRASFALALRSLTLCTRSRRVSFRVRQTCIASTRSNARRGRADADRRPLQVALRTRSKLTVEQRLQSLERRLGNGDEVRADMCSDIICGVNALMRERISAWLECAFVARDGTQARKHPWVDPP